MQTCKLYKTQNNMMNERSRTVPSKTQITLLPSCVRQFLQSGTLTRNCWWMFCCCQFLFLLWINLFYRCIFRRFFLVRSGNAQVSFSSEAVRLGQVAANHATIPDAKFCAQIHQISLLLPFHSREIQED